MPKRTGLGEMNLDLRKAVKQFESVTSLRTEPVILEIALDWLGMASERDSIRLVLRVIRTAVLEVSWYSSRPLDTQKSLGTATAPKKMNLGENESQAKSKGSPGDGAEASNALGDGGRVSASNVQTAPIAHLPPELLSEIIGLVAANGVKVSDVENTLRSCRALYCAGLPMLFREVTLDSKTGVEKLKALAVGPTGIDKTEYVRVLKVPAGLAWTGKTTKVLAKCLLNTTRFEFTARGQKVLQTVWGTLQSAPVLKELMLELHGDAFLAFDKHTVFPASVRLLVLQLQERQVNAGKHAQLFTMINDRAPNLLHLEIEGASHYGSFLPNLKLAEYPVLSDKMHRLTASPRDALCIPTNVTDLTLLLPARWSWANLYENAMTHLGTLKQVETLTLDGASTSHFVDFADLFPSLRVVTIRNAYLDLHPARFAAAAAALAVPTSR
jgi:hypothetical protein